MAAEESTLPCDKGPCKYTGFKGLVRYCRHPQHVEPIVPARIMAIVEAGGKCKEYIDYETKCMAGQEPLWPMPVRLAGGI